MKDELPVNSERARHILGGSRPCAKCVTPGNPDCDECGGLALVATPWGRTRMSALRRAMGLTQKNSSGRATGGRYFLISQVRKFLRDNPTWTETQVYPSRRTA